MDTPSPIVAGSGVNRTAASGLSRAAMAAALSQWWDLAGLETMPPPSQPRRVPGQASPSSERDRATAPVRANAATATRRPAEAVTEAEALAAGCDSLEALKAAIAAFDGCGLKRGARSMVFSDGNAGSPVMVVGEAPGKEDEEEGLPFAGRSGRFFDTMLATVGLERARNLYLASLLPWRPPGSRPPTGDEIAVCLPFIRRHIALARPRVLVIVGGQAAQALLQSRDGMMKLRGRIHRYDLGGGLGQIPAHCLLPPAHLLGRPQDKALAWKDLLRLQDDISV